MSIAVWSLPNAAMIVALVRICMNGAIKARQAPAPSDAYRRRVAQYVLGDVGHCAVEILVRPGVEVGQGDLEGWTGVRCHRPSFPQPTRASHRLAGYDSSLDHATPTFPCTNDTDAPASTDGPGASRCNCGVTSG